MAGAQDADQANEGDTELEEIIVTGSRLRRDRDFVAISPVQTIALEEIRFSGSITLEDTLNRYPQLVPQNIGTTAMSGGTGVLALNLRGARSGPDTCARRRQAVCAHD